MPELCIILSLLAVCYGLFCFYPTHANTPSSLSAAETGTQVSQQVYAPPDTTLPVDLDTGSPSQVPPILEEQSPAPSSGPSNLVAVKEATEVNQDNQGGTVEPAQSLTPLPSTTPPAAPTSDDSNQLIKRVDSINNQVAITFDDGPIPDMTAQYLAVLDKLNARATFFMIGQNMEQYPELVHKVVQYGNEIGSHSWQHSRLDQLTPDAIAADFLLAENLMQTDLGQKASLFRPPYGRRNAEVLAVAKQLGYQVIIWDIDPRDWENPPPEKIIANILEHVKPGSIILMHEGRPNTLKALPIVIQKLRERGLEPVPVSEMLSQNPGQL